MILVVLMMFRMIEHSCYVSSLSQLHMTMKKTTTTSGTTVSDQKHLPTTPKKLLIVGGGIGGLSSAFDAKHNLHPHDEVTVLSDRQQFQFTPSNPWVSTRMRTPEDIRCVGGVL
jgi:hypothetical protein